MSEITPTFSSLPLIGPVDHRSRRRAVLLAALGGLMVALPLVLVLRYQGQSLRALRDQRAALDPMARTVDVQRGVLLHRALADFSLSGDLEAEARRRTQQQQVDARLAALDIALNLGRWIDARRECDAMRDDWSLLAQQIRLRHIDLAASREGHRLMVEQLLQIMDLLDPRDAESASASNEPLQLAWRVMRTLPRLQAATVEPAVVAQDAAPSPTRPPAPGDIANRQLTEAALATLLGRINRSLSSTSASLQAEWSQMDVTAWARASAELGNASDELLRLLSSAPSSDAAGAAAPMALHTARAALWKAQQSLFDLAQRELEQGLIRRQQAIEDQRNALLLALAALAVAMLIVSRPWAARRTAAQDLAMGDTQPMGHAKLDADADQPKPATRESTPHGIEARRLLGRLREAAPTAVDIEIEPTEAPAQRDRAD